MRPSKSSLQSVSSVSSVALTCVCVALVFVRAHSARPDDDFSETDFALDTRLETTLEDLSTLRRRVAEEKLPLSTAVAKLEDEVARLRSNRARLVTVSDSSTIDLSSLRKQVSSLSDQDEFIKSRLSEFVRNFEGRLHIAELPLYEDLTSTAKFAEKNVALDAEGKRKSQFDVVRAALERLREQLGGQVFPGEALGPDGVLTQGRFIALGPTVFYVADSGDVSGIVESRLNAADPVVVDLPDGMKGTFAQIASTGQGMLPLDPTLGKALKLEKAHKTLTQYVQEGGIVGYVIIALGLAAAGLTLFKIFEISGFKVAPPEAVDEILEELSQGSQAAAAKCAEKIEGIAGEMLETGVRHAAENRDVLEELLFEKMLRVRPRLERFLPFLSITAASAPLLGLLGTVIGMINTFQLITIFGTGDAKSLSSGISEALMTTAQGLVVAIPILILHGALSRMAKRKLGMLEELSVAFINGVDVLRISGEKR